MQAVHADVADTLSYYLPYFASQVVIMDLPGFRWRGRCTGFAIAFEHAESTRVELIRFIYSGRYSATVPRSSGTGHAQLRVMAVS